MRWWSDTKQNVPYMTALNGANVRGKNVGKYVFKVRWKWENKISKTQPLLQANAGRE